MSRKSAYALKARDPDFAAAWDAALTCARNIRQVDEVQEVHNSRTSLSQGDKAAAARRRDRQPPSCAGSTSSAGIGSSRGLPRLGQPPPR
jgi:hypothetical protein